MDNRINGQCKLKKLKDRPFCLTSTSTMNGFKEESMPVIPSAPPLQPPNSADQTFSITNYGYPAGPPDHFTSSPPVPWSTGLCDCCDDVSSCCLTCWCPCITFGRIAEIVDRGSTSCGVSGALYTLILCVTGCSCMYSCFYRSKLRGQYFLVEQPCTDCCVHCCCEGCSLCQEYRELKNHGFDMSIGWHGNVERRKRSAAMKPAVYQGMKR